MVADPHEGLPMTDSRTAADRPLDAICMGRAGVDLYGEQVGGRLEDMASFAKYVGGSPTNTAIAGPGWA